MKQTKHTKALFLCSVSAFLAACSTTAPLKIETPAPAPASVKPAKAQQAPVHRTVTLASSLRPRMRPGEKADGGAERAAPGEVRLKIYLTGYSYWSNTPPASAAIARPVIHQHAGGTGTYQDPITIAVGHSINGLRQTLDFPQGTRFYLAHLRKYAIVEDVCGDGPRPQDEACHIGYKGHPWLDLYVGGSKAGQHTAYACAVKITSVMEAVMHPAPDYPVATGALAENGCPTFAAPGAASQQVASLDQ